MSKKQILRQTQRHPNDVRRLRRELKERISEIQKQKIIDRILLKMKNQFVEYCEENNLDLTDAFELVGFTKGGMIRKTKLSLKTQLPVSYGQIRGKNT